MICHNQHRTHSPSPCQPVKIASLAVALSRLRACCTGQIVYCATECMCYTSFTWDLCSVQRTRRYMAYRHWAQPGHVSNDHVDLGRAAHTAPAAAQLELCNYCCVQYCLPPLGTTSLRVSPMIILSMGKGRCPSGRAWPSAYDAICKFKHHRWSCHTQ
jgi:hypothetical protein